MLRIASAWAPLAIDGPLYFGPPHEHILLKTVIVEGHAPNCCPGMVRRLTSVCEISNGCACRAGFQPTTIEFLSQAAEISPRSAGSAKSSTLRSTAKRN